MCTEYISFSGNSHFLIIPRGLVTCYTICMYVETTLVGPTPYEIRGSTEAIVVIIPPLDNLTT